MVETTSAGAEQSQTAAAAASSGTTAIPEFRLPEEMDSLHDLRQLHKATEEIIRVRSQQVERGKQQKAKNQETLDALKQKNEVLKSKIKEQALAADQAEKNNKGKRNAEKDLAIKRRKLDDLKSKTATKRQQFNSLQQRAQEVTTITEDMNNDDHPMMRQIRVLGNRLDKVMIKYNESVEMRKTYEVVHTKLTEERLGYEK